MNHPPFSGILPGSAAALAPIVTGWTDDGTVVRLTTATDQVGIGTTAPLVGSKLDVVMDDAVNNAVTDVVVVDHATSGVSTASIGTGLLFRTEATAGLTNSARVAGVLTNVGAGTEAGKLAFYTRSGGGALTERWDITALGGFLPFADNTYSIGSSALRAASVNVGTSYLIFAAASDANPTLRATASQIDFGAGAGSVTDATIARTGVATLTITSNLIPNASGGDLGTSALRWDVFHSTINGPVREVVAAGVDNLQASDYRIYYDPTAGGQTPTLPAIAGVRNREYVVMHASASGNAVTITPQPGETINGAASLALSSFQGAQVYAPTTGTDWKAELRVAAGAAVIAADRIPFGDGTSTYLSSANLQFVTASTSFRVGNPTVGANDAGVAILNGVVRVGTGLQSYGVGAGATIGNARGAEATDLQFNRAAATQVASGTASAIVGGRQNTASNNRSFVGGGLANNCAAEDAAIVGGSTNTITSGIGQYSFIGAGANNTVGSLYSAAFGRVNVSTSGSDYSYMFGEDNDAQADYTFVYGVQAIADHHGEFAHSSGVFAAVGDAQVGEVVWRRSTTDGTANVELFLNGSSLRYTLADDSTYAFYILLSARRTDANDESAAYEFRGCIDRNAGVTALVGTVTKTVLAEDTAAWEADVVASDANDALVIQVTGEAGKTIRWVAYGKIVRTSG